MPLADSFNLLTDLGCHGLGQHNNAGSGLRRFVRQCPSGLLHRRNSLPANARQAEPPDRFFIRYAKEVHERASNLLEQHHADRKPKHGQAFRKGHNQDGAGEQFRLFGQCAHGG